MTTESKTEEVKKLTITLTDRPPVKITEGDWPTIAEGSWDKHDGKVECQANRRWKVWLKVRQHADGRTIIYGRYSYATAFQGESDSEYRDGQLITPTPEEYPESIRDSYWTGPRIVAAIHEVGNRLAERSGHECWPDVIAETIAELPAEELT